MKRLILLLSLFLFLVPLIGQTGRYPFYVPVVTTGGSSGGEMLLNGDFGSATGWTLGTYWAITGGQAVYTSTAGSTISQADGSMLSSVTPNTTYILEFDIISTDYKTDLYVFDSSAIEYYNLHISYEGTGTDLQFEFTTPANIGDGGIAFAASNWSFVIDNMSLTVKP